MATDRNLKEKWGKKASDFLVGKTIAQVRYLTDQEREGMDFQSSCLCIIFNDNSYIFPMRDDEGNDAGALSTSNRELEVIPVI